MNKKILAINLEKKLNLKKQEVLLLTQITNLDRAFRINEVEIRIILGTNEEVPFEEALDLYILSLYFKIDNNVYDCVPVHLLYLNTILDKFIKEFSSIERARDQADTEVSEIEREIIEQHSVRIDFIKERFKRVQFLKSIFDKPNWKTKKYTNIHGLSVAAEILKAVPRNALENFQTNELGNAPDLQADN